MRSVESGGPSTSSPDTSLLPDVFVSQSLHRGASVVARNPLTVATSARQWGYALSCALPPHIASADGSIVEAVRCIFDISVSHGRIGVGWTSLDGKSYVTERFTSRADSRISFLLQPGDRVGRLIFRNVDASGEPSEFTIHGARVDLVPAGERRYPVAISPREFAEEAIPGGGGTLVAFDTDAALAINRARLAWLGDAQLPIEHSRVLDIGCGVGHFISFYADRGCTVVAVDGRRENIAELQQRYPNVDARVADAQRIDPEAYGSFDVIHCFGLLYHLESPIAALRNIAAMCRRLLILETMVCDSSRPVSVLVDETKTVSQAMDGLGSRPSPSFLALALNRVGFDHVYGAAMPPDHPDFQFTWQDNLDTVRDGVPLRCVVVASRTRLDLPSLVPLLES